MNRLICGGSLIFYFHFFSIKPMASQVVVQIRNDIYLPIGIMHISYLKNIAPAQTGSHLITCPCFYKLELQTYIKYSTSAAVYMYLLQQTIW